MASSETGVITGGDTVGYIEVTVPSGFRICVEFPPNTTVTFTSEGAQQFNDGIRDLANLIESLVSGDAE